MRVTVKGQVTIPQHIRAKLGITPYTEIDFAEDSKRFYLVKKTTTTPTKNRFHRLRGIATVKMSTDEIMSMTRGHK